MQLKLCLNTPETVKQIPNKLEDVRKYGFEHGEYEGWEKQGPGQFVIDDQGIIIHALKGWLDVDSLIDVFQFLRNSIHFYFFLILINFFEDITGISLNFKRRIICP